MDTKLTLKLNQEIIQRAKKYASEREVSLSKIVETYLKSLTSEKQESDFEISPFVRSLATGANIPTDLDYKEKYSRHLLEKYR